MPFRDPEAGDLATRISAGLRQRIEEAVEAACLDIVVNRRRSRGLPAPSADSEADRAEYEQVVNQLLARLQAELAPLAPEAVRAKPSQTGPGAGAGVDRLIAGQAALARELPDYWQRFDSIRTAFAGELAASGSERGSFLRRLFGGG